MMSNKFSEIWNITGRVTAPHSLTPTHRTRSEAGQAAQRPRRWTDLDPMIPRAAQQVLLPITATALPGRSGHVRGCDGVHVHDVSAERADKFVMASRINMDVSDPEVSRICADPGDDVAAFHDRPGCHRTAVCASRRDYRQSRRRPAGRHPSSGRIDQRHNHRS